MNPQASHDRSLEAARVFVLLVPLLVLIRLGFVNRGRVLMHNLGYSSQRGG